MTTNNIGVVSILNAVNILFLAGTILSRLPWLACHVGIELREIKLAAGPSLLAVRFGSPLRPLVVYYHLGWFDGQLTGLL